MQLRIVGVVLFLTLYMVNVKVSAEGTSSSAYDEAVAAHSGPVPPAHFAVDDPIVRRENTKDDDPPEVKFRTPEEIQQKLSEWIDGDGAHSGGDDQADDIPSGSDVDSAASDQWPKSRRGHHPGKRGKYNSQEERRRRREEAERLRAERIAAYNAKEEVRKAERIERIRKREEERKENEKLRAEKRSQSQSQRREQREQRPTPPVPVQDEEEIQRRREEGKNRREERRQQRMKDAESRSQSRTERGRPGPESSSGSASHSQPPTPQPNIPRTGPSGRGSSSHSFSDANKDDNVLSPNDRAEIEATNARHTAEHKRRSDEKIAEFERKDRERKERFERNRKLQEEKRAKLQSDHRDRLDPRGPRP